jgi:hypothetical protein
MLSILVISAYSIISASANGHFSIYEGVTALRQHQSKVGNLSAILSLPRKTFQSIVLKRSPGESHCARPHLYKGLQSLQIDVSELKNVLHVEYVAKGKDQNNLSFFFNKGKKNQEVN